MSGYAMCPAEGWHAILRDREGRDPDYVPEGRRVHDQWTEPVLAWVIGPDGEPDALVFDGEGPALLSDPDRHDARLVGFTRKPDAVEDYANLWEGAVT